MYNIQHCFISRPSDSTVSEDAGIEHRIVASTALTIRRSNHSAKSHPHSAQSPPLVQSAAYLHFCGFVRLLLYESAFEVARELKYCSARKLTMKVAIGLWGKVAL